MRFWAVKLIYPRHFSPLFIKVPVPSQGREWHVFAMGIDFTSVSMFIRLNVGVVPTVLFFLVIS